MDLRTVKVFIASSDELTPERKAFDTLFNHLNSIFNARGVRLELVRWEFLDSSMGLLHKQEEYNREIKKCDICVVMFWQKFGEYTEAELKVADAEMREGRKPIKIYTFFKEPGDISATLQEFKDSFDRVYGHFYGKFDCSDKLQLDFVLQLERYLHSNLVKVEDSQVKIDKVVVAHLDNVGFAAGNEKYKTLRERLQTLEQDITSLDTICQTTPNPTIENMLNEKKAERCKLKEELREHEQLLLGAAVRVAQFAGERISDRMKRAIELFEQGKIREANVVLEEAKYDADEILRGVREVKSVGRQSIDELLLKASYMLVDETLPIDERIVKTEEIYTTAYQLAKECDYEGEKYCELLFSYAEFLLNYAKYDEAIDVYQQILEIGENIQEDYDVKIAKAYNGIGLTYYHKGSLDKAVENLLKSLDIREKKYGVNHPDVGRSCNNIGYVLYRQNKYMEALEYFYRALDIKLKVNGEKHLDTAITYNNIGLVYLENNIDIVQAYSNIRQAFDIKKQVLDKDDIKLADSYSDLGRVLCEKAEYEQAHDCHKKAIYIRRVKLGNKHPNVAKSHYYIGVLYFKEKKYAEALGEFKQAYEIMKDSTPNSIYVTKIRDYIDHIGQLLR